MRRSSMVAASAVLAFGAAVASGPVAAAAVGAGGPAPGHTAHGHLLATLTDPVGAPGDDFGFISVSISGNTAVVPAEGTNLAHGAVYIYVKGRHGWPASPATTLPEPTGNTGTDFGVSVAIDGGTALVGADSTSSGGTVYTYLRGTNGWPTSPSATLADPAATPGTDFFGNSVAVDGATGLGGAWGTSGDVGAAYIFTP